MKRHPRCVQEFKLQYHDGGSIDTFCDADFAGDLADRKSTSSVFIFHGRHLVRSVVSTQSVIALSSGESEFAAVVKGASASLGTRALAQDLGMAPQVVLHTDSSAAQGIVGRRGVGRIRHLHTPLLWIQQRVASKDMALRKTDGERNPADLGTKELTRPKMDAHLTRCGFKFEAGRHPRALAAQSAGPGDFGLGGYGGILDSGSAHGGGDCG